MKKALLTSLLHWNADPYFDQISDQDAGNGVGASLLKVLRAVLPGGGGKLDQAERHGTVLQAGLAELFDLVGLRPESSDSWTSIESASSAISKAMNESLDSGGEEMGLVWTAIGIFALSHFRRLNFTGPTPVTPWSGRGPRVAPFFAVGEPQQDLRGENATGEDLDPHSWMGWVAGAICGAALDVPGSEGWEKLKDWMAEVRDGISTEGEVLVHGLRGIDYLWLARTVLVAGLNHLMDVAPVAAPWFAARALHTSAQVLTGPTPGLQAGTFGAFTRVCRGLGIPGPSDVKSGSALTTDELTGRSLVAIVYIEAAHVAHHYHDTNMSTALLAQAQVCVGLDAQLTGALGYRTVHQTIEFAQMLLSTKRDPAILAQLHTDVEGVELSSAAPGVAEGLVLPTDLQNMDPDLLQQVKVTGETPEFTDSSSSGELTVVEQALLLALCADVHNTNPAHGLTQEQMLPYVGRVLETPQAWAVEGSALILRSRLELEKSRTRERSTTQYQELADDFESFGVGDEMITALTVPVSGPQWESREKLAGSRLGWTSVVAAPSIWDLQLEVAHAVIALGLVKTALPMFARLGSWTDVATCYRLIEEPKRAEQVIEAQLEREPENPSLWCTLGEIRDDNELYEKAWEVSGRRYGKARRMLGSYHFRHENWNDAVAAWDEALALNPLYPFTWFNSGCAAMKVDRWEKAASSFMRAVQQDSEYAAAWANAGSCYVKLKDYRAAFNALKEALRGNKDNWKMWENFMVVALEVEEWASVIRAVEQVFELTKGARVDVEVLSGIVDAVEADKMERRRAEKLPRMFSDLSSKVSTNVDMWEAYGRLWMALGDVGNGVDQWLKGLRVITGRSSWADEADLWAKVVHFVTERLGPVFLADGALDGKPELVSRLYPVRLAIQGAFRAARDNYEETDDYRAVERVWEALKAAEAKSREGSQ